MIHWLQIGGIKYNLSYENKQWINLYNYLNNYPDSETTIYIKETGDIYCKIVKLECNQNYNELDLDCNSYSSGSIKHLNYKPNNIIESKCQLEYFIDRINSKAII